MCNLNGSKTWTGSAEEVTSHLPISSSSSHLISGIQEEKEQVFLDHNMVQVLLSWVFRQTNVYIYAINVMGKNKKKVEYIDMDRADSDRSVLPGMAP